MLKLPESGLRRTALIVLSLMFVAAGVNHFVQPDLYLGMMPPWLPWHRELIWLSGLLEVVGGLAVLAPSIRRPAGWGLILLLIAVFPANIHMAVHPETFPDIPAWALVVRLPLQVVLAAWAWWATRPDPPTDG